MQRRQVLWGLPLTLASAWLTRSWLSKAHAAAGSIPRRALGSTGEQVSMVGLGGAHIGTQKDPRESIGIIRAALDAGVNFLDNCWDYNGGESERRMGRALRDGYRDKAFLMSKIDGRNRATAAKQIDESLQRLQTDRIDLMQIHEVIRDSDPERVFASGGALEALVAAQKAGKIRYIGFTGHKSAVIHAKMLSVAAQHNFKFDTVQMPLNVMDAHDDGFEKRILPLVTAQKIGVLGMKPLGGGIILKSGTVSALECLQYALSLPTSVVITGCDSMRVLQQALTLARAWKPLAPAARDALLARTAKPSAEKRFELYKTSQHFDGTTQNPEWLG
ncbi:MAG TPA: aldo/keto reductase [Polyangiales bacterium]|nr:aldo/keto reductase [Polyangiales bacterium]